MDSLQIENHRTVTDIIIVMDSSKSMTDTAKETINAVNVFIEEQKSNSYYDTATLTLVTFNELYTVVIDHKPILNVPLLNYIDYKPDGVTALNDCVCSIIENEIHTDKPYNKVVVIVTDGEENSSIKYSTIDLKNMIEYTEDSLGWKFVFLGANIDALTTGENINISHDRCAQFYQKIPGDLIKLSRDTSISVKNYRRGVSEGKKIELVLNKQNTSCVPSSFVKLCTRNMSEPP